ncbi:MAG: tRNA lysidine(34) synthetase TilS [Deltaproteobacteria bacterium]|nr:tRNA lysidine(34) synthetase TilS [Deltaproteobacteria bacterium]
MTSQRSHPPALFKLVERTVREEGLIERGDTVLVGVSGGPDSIALAHVLWRLRERLGFEVSALGVDHGLRAEAGSELEQAAGVLGSWGMQFETVRLSVGRGANLMARAREGRLGALRHAAERLGAARIALGHHADDRAETVLIRLLQGSGPAGVAALPPQAGDLIRPLIRARRSDVMRHLERHGVPYSTDPTNEDRHHLRVSVRLDVMPVLERLSPRIVEHLCDLADDLGALGLPSPTPALKRAQLQAMARAAEGGRSIRVALPGGRTARFDPKAGSIVIEARPRASKRAPPIVPPEK